MIHSPSLQDTFGSAGSIQMTEASHFNCMLYSVMCHYEIKMLFLHIRKKKHLHNLVLFQHPVAALNLTTASQLII